MQLIKPSALRFFLVAAALALGSLAQLLVSEGYLRWAITPFIVAVGAIALAVARRPLSLFAPSTPVSPQPVHGREAADVRFGGQSHEAEGEKRLERRLGVAGLVLSVLLLLLALRQFANGPSNTLAWYLYGASVLLVLLALPSLEGRWSGAAQALRLHRRIAFDSRAVITLVALGLILLLASVLRLYHLQELPAGLWFDEADNLGQAMRIQADPGATPAFFPGTNLPTLFWMPVAGLIELTGVSMTTGRLVSVAFGLAGIVAMFLLVRAILGSRLGLVAALLAAVMRWDLNWSRIGMHGITLPLFTALTAYLTLRALRNGRASDFGHVGAALGVGMWFYTPFLLFPLVVGFILLHHWVFRRPRGSQFFGNVLLMVFVASVVAAPLVQAAATESGTVFGRTRTTSVFSMMPLGDALGQVGQSLGEHALMFNYQGDPNPRHNLPGAPMLDFISGVLLVLGLGLALGRWRDVALISLPAWLLLMSLPGALTVPWESPQSLRAMGVLPAVVVIITLAIGAIWQAISAAPWPVVRQLALPFLAALVGGVAFLNVNTYFGPQARDPRVYASFSTDETLMARDMVEQQRRGYTLFTSRQFKYSLTALLLAQAPRYEVIAVPVGVPLDSARVQQGAAIYLEPREHSVYRLLQAYYPGGEFNEVRPPGGGEVLMYTAKISREQLQQAQGMLARYSFPDNATREEVLTITETPWWLASEAAGFPVGFQWEGALHVVEPGQYLFALEGEGEADVKLDGRTILGGDLRLVQLEPAVGLHSLEVEGRVQDRRSAIRLIWQPPGGVLGLIPGQNLYRGAVRPVGLAGRYFRAGDEGQIPDAMNVTPAMDTFYYDPVLPEPYLAVWEGRLEVQAVGEYRFEVGGNGPVKLSLDGELLAQQPGDSPGRRSPRVSLEAGSHRIRVEYQPPAPPSQFEVLWEPPGGDLRPIPIERLSPAPEHMFRLTPAAAP